MRASVMSATHLPEPQIKIWQYGRLKDVAEKAFEGALAGCGELDETVYGIQGFCGRKHRLFLNNLLRALPNPRYLEIGLFKGATFCAALWHNKVAAVGVDNWSEYDHGSGVHFYRNLALCKGPAAQVTIIERDFRRAPIAAFGSFNVGFY